MGFSRSAWFRLATDRNHERQALIEREGYICTRSTRGDSGGIVLDLSQGLEIKTPREISVGVQESFDGNDKPEYSLFHSIKRNKK